MNKVTEVTEVQNLSMADRARLAAAKASTAVTALMISGGAFAQGDVEAAISSQLALALGIVVLGTTALLTIRYSKMARRA